MCNSSLLYGSKKIWFEKDLNNFNGVKQIKDYL